MALLSSRKDTAGQQTHYCPLTSIYRARHPTQVPVLALDLNANIEVPGHSKQHPRYQPSRPSTAGPLLPAPLPWQRHVKRAPKHVSRDVGASLADQTRSRRRRLPVASVVSNTHRPRTFLSHLRECPSQPSFCRATRAALKVRVPHPTGSQLY